MRTPEDPALESRHPAGLDLFNPQRGNLEDTTRNYPTEDLVCTNEAAKGWEDSSEPSLRSTWERQEG